MEEYKKFVFPKTYFRKKTFKHDILNHLYIGPNLFFWWTALGRFGHFFIFTQPTPTIPHHEKAYYGPVSERGYFSFYPELLCLKITGQKGMVYVKNLHFMSHQLTFSFTHVTRTHLLLFFNVFENTAVAGCKF